MSPRDESCSERTSSASTATPRNSGNDTWTIGTLAGPSGVRRTAARRTGVHRRRRLRGSCEKTARLRLQILRARLCLRGPGGGAGERRRRRARGSRGVRDVFWWRALAFGADQRREHEHRGNAHEQARLPRPRPDDKKKTAPHRGSGGESRPTRCLTRRMLRPCQRLAHEIPRTCSAPFATRRSKSKGLDVGFDFTSETTGGCILGTSMGRSEDTCRNGWVPGALARTTEALVFHGHTRPLRNRNELDRPGRRRQNRNRIRYALRLWMPARCTFPGRMRPTTLSATLPASTRRSRSIPVSIPIPRSM